MSYLRPLPEVHDEHRPFWDGAREHRFLVPVCTSCGTGNWPPYPACRACLNEDFDWTEVSGDGEVYSCTIVRRGPGDFENDVPYGLGLVQLEGLKGDCLVMGRISADDLEQVDVGSRVRVVYQDIPDEDVTIWAFELVP